MSDPITRYVFLRMKLNAIRFFLPAIPVTMVFFIVALRYDVLPFDLLISLIPMAIAAIALCISLYQPMRFVRMIRKQEALLSVTFGAKKFAPLSPRTSYHASPDWFICMGSWAIFRGYAVKVTQQMRGTKTSRSYYARVDTVDGKTHTLRMESASDLKAFCQWYKNP